MKSKSEILAELTSFRAARDAILAGSQSYSINGRALARADLQTILDQIKDLELAYARADRGGSLVAAPKFGA